MVKAFRNRVVKDVGSWQESFVPTCSERIRKAKERALRVPELCMERARADPAGGWAGEHPRAAKYTHELHDLGNELQDKPMSCNPLVITLATD